MNYLLSRKRPESTRLIVNTAIEEARDRFKREDVEIVVKKADKSRTGQQNRYFWALCGLVEKETGTDKEVVKAKLMHVCDFTLSVWSNGEALIIPLSTTKLNRQDFGTLINATQSLCDELGIKYPLPEELGYSCTVARED